jgi:5-methylcytosine-specific restriction enzyme B
MSQYCGEIDPQPIFRAVEQWRTRALLVDGSVLSEAPLWSLQHLREIEQYFVNNLDESEKTFLDKLRVQLAPTSPEAKKLAAEMLWVMLLCPTSISAEKKRDTVQTIWEWSGEPFPGETPWLSTRVLKGIGSAGQSFNYNRWRELIFFVRLMIAFKVLDSDDKKRLLGNEMAFAEWMTSIPEESSRQLRHMLLFLLFPDDCERIFGGSDRREIVVHFAEKPRREIEALTPIELDGELRRIRAEQEQKYQTKELDFYVSPLVGIWKTGTFAQFTKDIERQHVLEALNNINSSGIPPDARSTTYDLIFEDKRYPPKLVLSLASKHARGQDFDRSLFSGGEKSPAFLLLRKLGFHIERKDFVSALLERFIKQAEAADDLSTKNYPKQYRGLEVAVSFGTGNFARIPWISFLLPRQKTSDGIYPVYLFYRDTGVLILAYGVSETNKPSQQWITSAETITVKDFLDSKFSKLPERYGASFVFAAYKVPDDLDPDRITTDLDKLVAEYVRQVGPSTQSTSFPDSSAELELELERTAPAPEPYTLDQALEGLFIEKEFFRRILSLWERKKNIVIQGPPGVGKTFFCRRLAFALMQEKAPERVELVQFHQTYAYEDFVQGYRPSTAGFELRDGLFHQFCEKARDDQERKYVFIIDEINRGNLSKIFGELMMLLEGDKRSRDWAVPLSYSQSLSSRFFIPPNVFLVGLMNTADRSLAVVDYALRRRFAFVDLKPSFGSSKFSGFLIEAGAPEKLVNELTTRIGRLNEAIAQDNSNLGPGFCIGHSFFCSIPKDRPPDEDWYQSVIQDEIAPLLREYWFDQPETAGTWIRDLTNV